MIRLCRFMSSKSIIQRKHNTQQIIRTFKKNSLHELENEFKQSDNKNDLPKYKTMKDLKLLGYKPIFSRQHLENCDLSKLEIVLTKQEKETFEEIKCAISNKEIFNKAIIVRCAGGWVRDKLLKCYSDDVDLAIDHMTGQEFGQCLQTYFATMKNEDLHIGKIQENPDKSKHLASATFTINNIDFDVVNLRTETYTQHSRIPIMAFGTAKEDAFRRDLTINSLFYNINTGVIEDFTGKGISDLIDGVVRTPLNAMITYRDDPLRVLRNIRHAITKLGFILDDDIIIAAQSKEIHKLLQFKVSRERFAVEFEKMLCGSNVWIAMHCLIKFGLAPILFEIPKQIANTLNDQNVDAYWNQSLLLTQNITQRIIGTYGSGHNEEKETKYLHNLSRCFGPNPFKKGKQIQKDVLFSAFTYPFHSIKVCAKKNRVNSLVMYFVLHSIPGMPNATKLAHTVNSYHDGCQLFIDLLQELQNEACTASNDKLLSLQIGKFLRITKENWIYVMYLVKTVCDIYHKEIDICRIDELQSWIVTKSQLIDCWNWKALINGKDLLQKYCKYGLAQDSRIGKINEFILEQRLSKPSITMNDLDDEIIEWLKQNPAPQPRSKKKSKKKTKN